MSAMNNEKAPNIAILPIGSVPSTTTLVFPGIYFRKRSRIKSVRITDLVGVAKDNTNYLAIILQDNAGSPVSYMTLATSDNALVAETGLEMVQVAGKVVEAEIDVPAGTQLNLSVASNGTAIPTSANACVEWYPL